MAARVTELEVRALLAPYADDVSCTIFIRQATMLVDEELVGKGLSDERLWAVELNLAAHFLTLTVERGGFRAAEIGEAREEYTNSVNQEKFSSTRFGQAAVSLDTSGTLNAIDSPGGRAEIHMQ